jgi:hypothetical protein
MSAASYRKPKRGVGFGKKQQKWINPPTKESGILWVQFLLDAVDTEAWRDLSINARRIVDVLLCHLIRSGRSENGKLEMSYPQFEAAGVPHCSISKAIRELVSAGFLEVKTHQGRATQYGLPQWRDDKKPFMNGVGVVQLARRPFFWVPVSVLEDPAWFEMPINSRRIIERILIENSRHGCGKENGDLRVSYRQFEGLGVAPRFIKPALNDLVSRGLLDIRGGQRQGKWHLPNFYRVTFLGAIDGPAILKSEAEGDVETVTELRKARG